MQLGAHVNVQTTECERKVECVIYGMNTMWCLQGLFGSMSACSLNCTHLHSQLHVQHEGWVHGGNGARETGGGSKGSRVLERRHVACADRWSKQG